MTLERLARVSTPGGTEEALSPSAGHKEGKQPELWKSRRPELEALITKS